ncbi:hypothetical protein AWZ03_012038 [Drosophila navojoa]|uniref:Uncharacterized protein n=1 Tax=Drosophila navojoa TaxID=7232 RepID=A0A484AZY9_DRONA|nr:hypothetical protein AWZ03_012038 [Drosophila navojoa]
MLALALALALALQTDNNSSTELARENLFQPNMDDAKPMNNNNNNSITNNNNNNNKPYGDANGARTICSIENHQSSQLLRHGATPPAANSNTMSSSNSTSASASASASASVSSSSSSSSIMAAAAAAARKRHLSNSNLVNDLEILDRELSAINAPMPLIDPEITQGAEQLERAALSASRKRMRSNSEDESDRLVREALSQFYIPPQRLISAIEDCPLDVVGLGAGAGVGSNSDQIGISGSNSHKRVKLTTSSCVGCGGVSASGVGVGVGGGVCGPADHIELVNFDMNQNQKDFEVIMDALRLGTPTQPSSGSDSCGQAAMMSESASVFHNLVVTSLET